MQPLIVASLLGSQQFFQTLGLMQQLSNKILWKGTYTVLTIIIFSTGDALSQPDSLFTTTSWVPDAENIHIFFTIGH